MSVVRYVGTSPIAGAPLAVYLQGTLTPADIYSDAELTPLANPFTTDEVNGTYAFYAEQTVDYDLTITTDEEVPLPDPPTAVDAPSNQAYVLMQAAAALPYARVLTAGANITLDLSTMGEVEISASGSGGGGDVVGPSSAIDDRIATFDSTTGKLIQDGGQTIAEVIAAAVSQASAALVMLALTSDPASPVEGQVWFFQSGTSPALAFSVRLRLSGVTYNFPIGTV